MANQMIALQTRNPQLPDPAKMTAQYANLMGMAQQNETAKRQAMQAQQTMDINAAQEARAARIAEPQFAKAQSEATAADIKTAMDFNNFVRVALSNSDSPDQVAAFAERIASQPQFENPVYQGALSDAIASMPTDPVQFEAWKEKTALSTLEADKRYEQVFKTQTTGTEQREIAMPKYGRGAAAEVPGSRFQVAQGMQYITDDQGNIRVVPKEAGGGFGTPAPAVGTQPSMGTPGQGGNTFARMIRQESGGKQFDRNGRPLTSSAGAIGIAQVMPKTAPEAARLAGLPFDDKRYRTDPEYNLALGKAYYEKQLADFGGDERLAAAAYNAGPGAVRRALQKGGPNGWINNVPAETRNYVKSVFGGGQTAGTPTGVANEPPIVVKGSGAKGKASTEGERRFGTISRQMRTNLKDAVSILQTNPKAIRPSGAEYAASQIPFYGEEARLFAESEPRQQFVASVLRFLDNITFVNTGAGTSKEQEANYRRSYIPTYQDTDASAYRKLVGMANFAKNVKDAAGVMWTPELDADFNALTKAIEKLKPKGAAAPKAGRRTPVPRKASGGFTVVKVED
jgi:hypothetical protein